MSHPTREELKEAVVAFSNDKLDNDTLSFTFAEAEALAFELGYSIATPVIRALKAIGMDMEERTPPKQFRTISCSSHDRWYGPGSIPSHGGSGWEQVSGFAGQEG